MSLTLKEATMMLTRSQVACRIKFSESTIARWTKQRVTGWPQPIPCGPQHEHRWLEIDIAKWIERERKKAKRPLQGALAPKRRTRTRQVSS